MLILILSKDLKLRFVSPNATAPFRPGSRHLGQPIEAAKSLMMADPGLSLDCRAALQREPTHMRHVGQPGAEGYMRRIMPRMMADERVEELIVSYEPGALAPHVELVQIRSFLDDALESLESPLGYYDEKDRLVRYNRAYESFHNSPEGPISAGMRFEQILRRNMRSGLIVVPEDQREEWLRERLAKRERPTFEREIRLPDGRWFRLTERRTSSGGRLHVLIDVTDLKSTQVSLQNVVTGARAAAWTVNIETGAGSANDRWAEMFGFDPSAILKIGFEDWRALVHPDDLSRAEVGFQECIAGTATSFEVEYRMRHSLGHWVWVMGRGGVSDRHTDGRPIMISGVLLDISQRKNLEAELAMRATAVASTEDGITITDAAGTILYTNPAHAAMFGHPDPSPLIGQPWYSLYSPKAAATLAAEAFPALRAVGHWQGEAEALRSDGQHFEQELSLTEMPDGKIICVNRDVTRRKSFDRERLKLRDRVEIAQRQEIVNLLVSGLLHDLFNLLAVIAHSSDPAVTRTGLPDPGYLQRIHRAAQQAIALLKPLRDFRLDNAEVEEIELGALLEEATDVVRLGAHPDLSVTLELPDEAIKARLNPLQLMQVLLNIGLNARDALEYDEKRIEFALSLSTDLPEGASVEIGKVPDDCHALFRITDTGTGIAPDIRSRLWGPLFTTKGTRGTGLGLSVAAEIVRSAGGAIALDTKHGAGSTFYVAWPLHPLIEQQKRSPDIGKNSTFIVTEKSLNSAPFLATS